MLYNIERVNRVMETVPSFPCSCVNSAFSGGTAMKFATIVVKWVVVWLAVEMQYIAGLYLSVLAGYSFF